MNVRSVLAIDCDLERGTDLAHAGIAESADAVDEHGQGHGLNGVDVDSAALRDRILVWHQDDFAGEDDDWTPPDVRRPERVACHQHGTTATDVAHAG